MDYKTASPAEIDAILSKHGQAEAVARARAGSYRAYLAEHEKALKGETVPRGSLYGRHATRPAKQLLPYEVEQYEELAAKYEDEAAVERKAQEPGEAEYHARGGWVRSFLVTNPGGHAHKSTACSTCYSTTQFSWLTELSGLTEAEVVELAGERACTVCYPSAPVNVLKRESQLRPDVEARAVKAAREQEKAEKAAAKEAKAIAMPDGSPLRERYGVIKTVVSAWRNAVSARADQLWYSSNHPSMAEWQQLIDNCVVALAHKLGRSEDDVRAEVEKKAQAKHKRDSR